jgi:hypothetical protein
VRFDAFSAQACPRRARVYTAGFNLSHFQGRLP